jgi:hypothetical protein
MDDAWDWSILAGFAAVLSGAAIAYAIQMRAERRYPAAWIWFMLTPTPLTAWTLVWAIMGSPPDGWRRAISILVGAVAGAAILLGATERWHGRVQAQPPTNQPGGNMTNGSDQRPSPGASGNFNINQQGGNSYQTYINQAPEKLRFTDALGAELLTKIPKDKPISVVATGSASDLSVGQQIYNFLITNGYQVPLTTVGVLVPPLDRPLTRNAAASVLTVAPSVR